MSPWPLLRAMDLGLLGDTGGVGESLCVFLEVKNH